MAKHKFIFEAYSWSFLRIFEAEPNFSDAYKKSVCSVSYKTFNVEKILIEKIDFLGETILYVVIFS